MHTIRIALLILCAVVISIPGQVQAALGGDQKRITDLGLNKFDVEYDECIPTLVSSTATTSTPTDWNNTDYLGRQILTQSQIDTIKSYQATYQQAASQVGIPWQMLAVTHLRETNLSLSYYDNGEGIYQDHGYTHNGGVPYPKSGQATTAEFLEQSINAAKDLMDGTRPQYKAGLASGNPDSVKDSFFGYNGRNKGYKQQALNLGFTQEQADIGEGSPYVMNKADAKREPSETWGQVKVNHGDIVYPANQDYGAFVVYSVLGPTGGIGMVSSCLTAAMGAIGSAGGLTFPLVATKQLVSTGLNGTVWCLTKTTNCHHDYNAADIFAPVGTTVVAAVGGTVLRSKTSGGAAGGNRASVQIRDNDGNVWYYTHGTPNSQMVQDGAQVEAGTPLMTVGPSSAADNTTPHLHIDELPNTYQYRVNCASDSCRGYPFIDIQSRLVAAYESLP